MRVAAWSLCTNTPGKNTHRCKHTHTHTCKHTHTQTHTHTLAHTHTHTHKNTYTHSHTYTLTHIQTYLLLCLSVRLLEFDHMLQSMSKEVESFKKKEMMGLEEMKTNV